MKRILCCLLTILMLFSLSSCKKEKKDIDGNIISNQDLNYVNKAIDIINQEWETVYSKINQSVQTDNMIEIINTRIIHIKDNNNDYFKDVDAVVEFDLLTDYYGSAPYYMNVNQNDTVVFYKDGSSKLLDIFRTYKLKEFESDFSDIIENIVECGETFNLGNIKTAQVKGKNEKYILDARELIQSEWSRKHRVEGEISDSALNIINTRLILINEKSEYPGFNEYFKDIETIVEFELYEGKFNDKSVYPIENANNTVIFYKDGTTKVTSNYFNKIGNLMFDYDFSDLINEMFYCGISYNQTITLVF